MRIGRWMPWTGRMFLQRIPSGSISTNWVPFTFQFTAGSTSSELRNFTDTSGQESAAEHQTTDWGLDLVTVTDLGGPVGSVPEPASMLLTAAGLAAIVLVRRRQCRCELRPIGGNGPFF